MFYLMPVRRGILRSDVYVVLLWALFGFAAVTFVVLLIISAPYGRHVRAGWGPTVPNRVGWIIMEAPASLVFAGVYLAGAHRADPVPIALLAMWELHYVYRTFVFPFRIRDTGKRMPLVIALIAVLFNTLNATLNARWVSALGAYPPSWFVDPRFLVGALVFAAGWAANHHADATLLRLRKPGETGYKIPRGGLYRYVSSPNYLTEIVEWTGWAIATWSLAGLGFAVYTAANLVPRALTTHRWYKQRFPDYPAERRAIVPFVL